MAPLAMTLPLLPGKTEDWKRWVQEMAGARLSEFQASRKRLGITGKHRSFNKHLRVIWRCSTLRPKISHEYFRD